MSNKFTNALNVAGRAVIKKSPTIMMVLGLGGFAYATVHAVRVTPKAVVLLEERKKELEVKKLPTKEIVKTTWKLYLPPAIAMVLSAACVVTSHCLNEKQKAALATACTVAETTMTELQGKMREELGEVRTMEIRDEVNQKIEEKFGDIFDAAEAKPKIISPMVWIREPCTGQEFYNSEATVREIINDLNETMIDGQDYISVNEYLDALGLNPSDTFGAWEWHIYNSGQIKVRFDRYARGADGSPILIMELRSFPKPPIKLGD